MIINNSQNVVKYDTNLSKFNDFGKSNENFEPVFQIGGKSYTQEEWEKLLEYVDEVEKETKEAMEIEQAIKEAEEA